ncbi:MAG: hypothetical protein WD851_12270 [Pirellulales bacterium]
MHANSAPPDGAQRPLTILAQDPAVTDEHGLPLTSQIWIPAERLAAGPWGYRVQVVDYDATTRRYRKPLAAKSYQANSDGDFLDPYANTPPDKLVGDPRFHAQNVYAIVMRILARFEFALGRRVSWKIRSHQLKVAPHAFAMANAFYSRSDEGLFFGYFKRRQKTVFTSLSHDIVAHETTHALLDGLRPRFMDLSSPDQGGFHEGFSDVVALLSVFAQQELVRMVFRRNRGILKTIGGRLFIKRSALTTEKLVESVLLGLAEEMGQELNSVRGAPLRQSGELTPSPDHYLKDPDFREEHRRGEILVAAMLRAFLMVLQRRLEGLTGANDSDDRTSDLIDLDRAVEDGATAADHLLTVAIRAIDYLMPVHITYGDYLSAMLTADHEVYANDEKYHYRQQLRDAFAAFGIRPASIQEGAKPGMWGPTDAKRLTYARSHFRSLQTDRDEVFRFLWENRKCLGLYENVYTEVISVRPCIRLGADGHYLQETIAEYVQLADMTPAELRLLRLEVPDDLLRSIHLRLSGGGTLIFDEFGRLKFHIGNRLNSVERQQSRLDYLVEKGGYRDGRHRTHQARDFAELHRSRVVPLLQFPDEELN